MCSAAAYSDVNDCEACRGHNEWNMAKVTYSLVCVAVWTRHEHAFVGVYKCGMQMSLRGLEGSNSGLLRGSCRAARPACKCANQIQASARKVSQGHVQLRRKHAPKAGTRHYTKLLVPGPEFGPCMQLRLSSSTRQVLASAFCHGSAHQLQHTPNLHMRRSRVRHHAGIWLLTAAM